MYVDILILESLVDRASYGYQIKKGVGRILGGAVTTNNNALYPSLKKFEEMGAVEKWIEPQEGKPDRHLYRATELGREILHELLREFSEEVAENEAEFLVRVAFFGDLEPRERLRILGARETVLRRRLKHLSAMESEALKVGRQYPYATRVVEFYRSQVEGELGWIDELARQTEESSER